MDWNNFSALHGEYSEDFFFLEAVLQPQNWRELKLFRSFSALLSPVSYLDIRISKFDSSSVLVFTEEAVLLELSKLNVSKSMGPENPIARVLFELRHEIAKQCYFQLSWHAAEVCNN